MTGRDSIPIGIVHRRRWAKIVILIAVIAASGIGVWIVDHPAQLPAPSIRLTEAVGLVAVWSLICGYVAAFLPASEEVRKHASLLVTVLPCAVVFGEFLRQTSTLAEWPSNLAMMLVVLGVSGYLGILPLKIRMLRYRLTYQHAWRAKQMVSKIKRTLEDDTQEIPVISDQAPRFLARLIGAGKRH
jgi:hypothetical protein